MQNNLSVWKYPKLGKQLYNVQRVKWHALHRKTYTEGSFHHDSKVVFFAREHTLRDHHGVAYPTAFTSLLSNQ